MTQLSLRRQKNKTTFNSNYGNWWEKKNNPLIAIKYKYPLSLLGTQGWKLERWMWIIILPLPCFLYSSPLPLILIPWVSIIVHYWQNTLDGVSAMTQNCHSSTSTTSPYLPWKQKYLPYLSSQNNTFIVSMRLQGKSQFPSKHHRSTIQSYLQDGSW